MAEIRPLRAWRYNRTISSRIEELVSPLFDVISEKQRQHLYREPFNSIHLSVPEGKDSALTAARTLINWKKDGTIKQDQLPSIYVYYQYFSLPGSAKEYVRKGFIANMRIYDWDDAVLLRHEDTMPYSVNDRMDILDKTLLNASPTHGLYTAHDDEPENYLDEAISNPIYETEDYQGVKNVFAVIQDAEIINRMIAKLSAKKIILADGHHRYEGALSYRNLRRNQNPDHSGREAYNYHMMYFTNTEADDLSILPTHRLVIDLAGFSEDVLLSKLDQYFIIKPIDDPHDINEVIPGKQWAFGLLFERRSFKIILKPNFVNEITWSLPDSIKQLDLTIMHYFIIEKCLGIPHKKQKGSRHLLFEQNFGKCLHTVEQGKANCAIITKAMSIETVKEVCHSGHVLPQKSTYFYPKVICGFLFGSIKQEEFVSPFDNAFC